MEVEDQIAWANPSPANRMAKMAMLPEITHSTAAMLARIIEPLL